MTDRMTDCRPIERLTVDDVDAHVRLLADDLTRVDEGECLYCYLLRMLDAFGCAGNSHHWTERWIDAQPRPAQWVLDWVRRNGGCCCDCEVIMNVFRDDRRSRSHRRLRCSASYAEARRADDAGAW